jgi:peptidoglycan/LPS O-acetylase OafA/YrhL
VKSQPSSHPPASPANQFFPCFDGLRAVAVLTIFAYHGSVYSTPILFRWTDTVLRFDSGVAIFFVVSGFLIYRPFVAAHLGGRPGPGLRNYALRRVTRIYPAYWVALACTALLGYTAISGFWEWFGQTTLTFSYFRRPGAGMTQAWTLVVEVSFYVMVPIYAWVMASGGRIVPRFGLELVAAASLVPVGFWFIKLVNEYSLPPALGVLPPALASLAAGMVLAVLSAESEHRGTLKRFLERLGRYPGVWWTAAILGFVVWCGTPLGYSLYSFARDADRGVPRQIQTVLAFLLVVPAVVGNQSRGLVRRFLRCAPMVGLGRISYGFYLWHFLVIKEIGRTRLGAHGVSGALVLLGGALVISVGLGAASYFAVERPVTNFVRRRIATRRSPSVESLP